VKEGKVEEICKNCANVDDNNMCRIIELRVDKDASCSNFEARMDMIERPLTGEYFLWSNYPKRAREKIIKQLIYMED